MESALTRSWSFVLVRGLLAIGFGLLTWARPGITLAFLVILFAVYVLDDGIFALLHAGRAKERGERSWPFVVEGIAGILLGILTLIAPATVATIAFLTIGVWAIVTGALEIVAAIRTRRRPGLLLGLAGALRVLLGVLVVARPAAGLAGFVWILGAYGIAYGVVMCVLSLGLRSERHVPQPAGLTSQPA